MTREDLLAADSVAIDALWTKLLELYADFNRISREHHYASAHLPWWAAPGRRYLVAEGDAERPQESGHPAIQNSRRPQMRGMAVLIRPGPHDIERRREEETRLYGADRADAAYAERMDAYRLRAAAQQAEQERLGLPTLDAHLEAINTEMEAVADRIEALPPSLERAAALTIMEIIMQGSRDETINQGQGIEGVTALQGLRMFLRGSVAATVADFLDNPTRPFGCSPLWGGYWPGMEYPMGTPEPVAD
jgi:hypothetical protein